ncbi:MAG: ATP-binding protein [Planctomycetota bacterium]
MSDQLGLFEDTFTTFNRISESLRHAYQDLRDRVEEVGNLEQLAAIGEMAAGIAHEIRNPLNAIEGFAGLMLRRLAASDPKSAEHARKILDAVRDANAIITDLLDFARPTDLAVDPVDLGALVGDVLRSETSEGVKTTLTLEGDPVLRGDARRIRQAVRNLVRNADQALGGQGELEVTIVRSAREATLRFEDDGPGLPEAVRERLFHPFVTTKPDGTGLGLAMVHKIAIQHGGRVTYRAGERGACFELTLREREDDHAH